MSSPQPPFRQPRRHDSVGLISLGSNSDRFDASFGHDQENEDGLVVSRGYRDEEVGLRSSDPRNYYHEAEPVVLPPLVPPRDEQSGSYEPDSQEPKGLGQVRVLQQSLVEKVNEKEVDTRSITAGQIIQAIQSNDEVHNELVSFLKADPKFQQECLQTKELDDTSHAGSDKMEKSNDDACRLCQDSFSFLISSRLFAKSWWIGIVTTCFEIGIFTLVVANLTLQNTTAWNPLSIPAIITSQVAIAQCVAILVTVLSQDDLRVSLQYFYLGYDTESLLAAFPHTSQFRYWTSACLQFIGGIFGLVTTFLLVVTSDEVIEIILNLTAIEFVSLLDNTAFTISRQGFFGTEPLRQATVIINTQYRTAPGRRALRQHLQVWALVLSFAVLVAGWVVVFSFQVNGTYAVNTFYAQFDDGITFDLGTYSGFYRLEIDHSSLTLSDRFRYISENEKSTAFFGYCLDSERWTFSLGGDDPCFAPVMRSARILSLDLAKVGDDEWFVADRSVSTTFYNMEDFYFSPGCENDDDCGGSTSGSSCQRDSKCSCLGTFGPRCAFSEESMKHVIGRVDGVSIFPKRGNGDVEYASEFRALRSQEDGELVLVYLHPVYFNANRYGQLDVVMYTGLRWIVTSTDVGFPGLDPSSHEKSQLAEALASYLRASPFYAVTELGLVDYISKPARFGTPDDAVSPTQVSWWSLAESQTLANATEDRDIADRLSELYCSDDSDCGRSGSCNLESRSCNCGTDSAGQLCQLLPLSDGYCDGQLNNGFNDFDGGDCCEETCQNGAVYRCGYDRDGTTFVGFSETCADAYVNPVNITISVGFDAYPEEVTMTLMNSDTVVKEWGPFEAIWSNQVWTETIEVTFSSSVFTLVVNDAGDDGMIAITDGIPTFFSIHYGSEDLLDMLLLYFFGNDFLSQTVKTFNVRRPVIAVPNNRLFVIFSGSVLKDTSFALMSGCDNKVQRMMRYDKENEAFQWWRDDSGYLFNVACRFRRERSALFVSREHYPNVFMNWVRLNKTDPFYPRVNSQWQVNRIDGGSGGSGDLESPLVEFRNRWAWQLLTSDRGRVELKEEGGEASPDDPKWRLQILNQEPPPSNSSVEAA